MESLYSDFVCTDYVNLLSDDEEEQKLSSPECSPSPPTYSPLSQDNVMEWYIQSHVYSVHHNYVLS